jgi:hypothetical protein
VSFIYVYRDDLNVHAVGKIETDPVSSTDVHTLCDETLWFRVALELSVAQHVTCNECRDRLTRILSDAPARWSQWTPPSLVVNAGSPQDVDQRLAEALDRKFNRPKRVLTDTEIRFSLLELD